ncbi:putative eka-like protein [Erysiphe necator]|uniref:Putative eka-like protein n=1 Tax=Uncinula necator TaxID=52586 RepID=A0A0B1PA23_UNCNE|nr:putative eka-like protein [Erysiphe necator]
MQHKKIFDEDINMIDSMEISQAPSTETSSQLPPIPPIHCIPDSPPPTASPSPPSLPQPDNTLEGRKILKPTIPSKRTIPDRISPIGSKNTDIENAFLPKELAEIIATRQRHERAWHARILICTTVISCIDSGLAIFEDEVEKEEVSALKAYLGLAIAKFAAIDSSPTPPHIPSHTPPRKANSYGLGKDKNVVKNVVVATSRIMKSATFNVVKEKEAPKLPKIPQIGEKTWATVARNGHKKTRVTLRNTPQVAPVIRATQQLSNKDKSPAKTLSDKRLFVRLPQDHEWRKLSPAGIREIIVQKLAISPSLFGKIKPVNSGFALSPCSTEARETILNAGNGLFLTGAKLEPATNWIPMIIPTIPSTIRKVQGEIEVSNSMLIDEVERVCSVRPAHVKLYGGNKTEAPHRTWMAYFSKAPRAATNIRIL